MRTRNLIVVVFLMGAFLGMGCGKGLKMDYGNPEAQFLEGDVVAKGKAFLGKKITVKGTVSKVDTNDSKVAWVYLSSGIKCNFGEFKVAAEGCKIGDIVYVDGILERCDVGDVLLAPAMLRDSTAPFSPVK